MIHISDRTLIGFSPLHSHEPPFPPEPCEPKVSPKKLQHNPEPMKVVDRRRCNSCRKYEPWCSCGEMDYQPASEGGDG